LVWKLKYKTSAKHEIKRLDKSVQREIYYFLGELSKLPNPRTELLPFTGPLSGYWKKRLGDYRLIIDVQDQQIIIEVIKAGHRSRIYR